MIRRMVRSDVPRMATYHSIFSNGIASNFLESLPGAPSIRLPRDVPSRAERCSATLSVHNLGRAQARDLLRCANKNTIPIIEKT